MRVTKIMIAKRLAKLEGRDSERLCRNYKRDELIEMLETRVRIAKCFGFKGIYVKEGENLLNNLHIHLTY